MARPKGDTEATAARRQLILEAALAIFGQNGFRGGSLSQISEAVGITEAGILHHFKTKGNLLIAVLEYRDALGQQVSSISSDMDGLEFVRSWFKLVEFNISMPGIIELYCVISAESTSAQHPAHDFFKIRYENVIHVVENAMRDLGKSGYLRDGVDPLRAARALVALSDGLQIQWLLNPKWDMVDEHISFFEAHLNKKCLTATKLAYFA
jgi:AcrR family transcriptional regulator